MVVLSTRNPEKESEEITLQQSAQPPLPQASPTPARSLPIKSQPLQALNQAQITVPSPIPITVPIQQIQPPILIQHIQPPVLLQQIQPPPLPNQVLLPPSNTYSFSQNQILQNKYPVHQHQTRALQNQIGLPYAYGEPPPPSYMQTKRPRALQTHIHILPHSPQIPLNQIHIPPKFGPQIQQKPILLQHQPIDLNIGETYHEHLRMAQSQNYYQQMPPLQQQIHMQSFESSHTPIKRKRRKSRRQRKVQNHSEEVNSFKDQLISKTIDTMVAAASNNDNELLENANNIAFAISLRKTKKNLPNSLNRIDVDYGDDVGEWKNSTKWLHIDEPKDAVKTPVSYKTSTSAGPSQTIIVSSSHSISSTTSHPNAVKKQNSIHRKETIKQRSTTIAPSTLTNDSAHRQHWINKYNIDYDNKLEDEYEIIMKDE